MRRVERIWALLRLEALRSGSSVTLKDKEPNAFRNLARLTGLVENLKKWLLQRFAANRHKKEKFAANAVNKRFMVTSA